MLPSCLQHALDAYNSTNRSRYPLNGKVVTNLEAVEYYLIEAITHLPAHFGLPMTIANVLTFRGEVDEALLGYQLCLSTASSDAEKRQTLCYLIVWYHYSGNARHVAHYLNLLQQISTEEFFRICALLNKIDEVLSQPLCGAPSSDEPKPEGHPVTFSSGPGHAIITLGYVLNDDGSMAPALIRRLELTLKLWRRIPESLIIVTGGLAKQGKTESQLMKSWLIAHGIEKNKIIEEDQAINTIENATLSLELLSQHQIRRATLVSASIHVHRSQLLFETLQMKFDTTAINFSHCAVEDGLSTEVNPTGQIRRNCYIDALRAYGLPAFNCAPLICL
ncbi:YdcF family protein [Photobacterium sp. SDRW27]|uniref:YdcF family protein n=1 Tax=Photobacterium obscurum TaxID=2829490 RepID=UPI0022434A96|nr:YdcF family protein [Photobacterium obscurum]MCW8330207.1 YdcF family protein [Photobacterium obscurum]